MYWSCIRLESGYLYWLCSNSLGYCSLKSEQKAVIKNFINGKDVFAVLPTFLGEVSAMHVFLVLYWQVSLDIWNAFPQLMQIMPY